MSATFVEIVSMKAIRHRHYKLRDIFLSMMADVTANVYFSRIASFPCVTFVAVILF
jgi:hypothetical protein